MFLRYTRSIRTLFTLTGLGLSSTITLASSMEGDDPIAESLPRHGVISNIITDNSFEMSDGETEKISRKEERHRKLQEASKEEKLHILLRSMDQTIEGVDGAKNWTIRDYIEEAQYQTLQGKKQFFSGKSPEDMTIVGSHGKKLTLDTKIMDIDIGNHEWCIFCSSIVNR